MPILKHAKKKLKQDKKRTLRNKTVKNTYKLAVKKARTEKNAKSVNAAFKAIDKAAKKNLIHKNKAARMKSALSKLIAGKSTKPTTAKTAETKGTKPKMATKTKAKATASAKDQSSSGRKKSK